MSYKASQSFEKKEAEISEALNTLKKHGLIINLPPALMKQLQATTLFDGDDGLFKELIKNAQTYFEYGCGKSTEYVYRHTSASIFAVDTSLDWVNKMNALKAEGNPDRLNLNWVDVGLVADWGMPTSFGMRHNFTRYAELFWQTENNPDLVLIDGRFRVLCFLTSVKFAKVGTKILFDDYADRPFYHVVEEFCQKLDTCGRQALFEVTSASKKQINDEVILSFQNVVQ